MLFFAFTPRTPAETAPSFGVTAGFNPVRSFRFFDLELVVELGMRKVPSTL